MVLRHRTERRTKEVGECGVATGKPRNGGYILGIETSCDETAAAVLDGEGRVLADIVLSQLPEHSPYGGVVPEIAARAHLAHLPGLVRRALEQAGATPADLAAVAAAGARFAISPGATPTLYAAARNASIPWLPAIATASELMLGLEHGLTRFKFFPAESSGGVAALKSFAGPFPQARFCPTGGIDAAKAPAYKALPNVITVGGSWMLPKAAIEAGRWDEIEALARAAS